VWALVAEVEFKSESPLPNPNKSCCWGMTRVRRL